MPGRAVLRFVVALDGKVAPCSTSLISGTNSLFVAAAVEMLENSRFTPAERGGRPVAAWAQQGFSWSSAGSDAAAD